MKRFLLILSALCIATLAFAQTSREEIDKYPHIAVSTHSTYAGPYYFKPIAEAPKGYEPFYISHYGRHGSRYEANAKHPAEVVSYFDYADKQGLLTPKGKEAKALFEKKDALIVAHNKFENIDLAYAQDDIGSVPFHAGAARYFNEVK